MHRVVSLVPSWTETLIHCGVQVVGRTRYCIEPAQQIQTIPVVGGTKDINWQKVSEAKPTLLVLDQEENPIEFTKTDLPWYASHIKSIEDLPAAFEGLAAHFQGEIGVTDRLLELKNSSAALIESEPANPCDSIPMLALEPLQVGDWNRPIFYLIWRMPYMCVTRHTFIGSMLERIGIELADPEPIKLKGHTNYPEINIKKLPKNSIVLLSTEPYPFFKFKKDVIEEIGRDHDLILIDGQALSWFGVRAIATLQKCLQK